MLAVKILGLLAGACALWGGITGARIGGELQRRGVKVRWVLMRIDVIGWVSDYRRLTTAESGRPGPLYRQFVTAMVLAGVLAILALLVRWLG